MEVHHHPHVEKKSFKEYLLEGLMIFLAVSLGFIAENIREHITENAIAHEMAEHFYQELETDSTKLAKIQVFRKKKEYACLYVMRYIKDSSLVSPTDSFYRYLTLSLLQMGSNSTFDPTDGILTQLQNSGTRRFFKNTTLQKQVSELGVTINFVRIRNERELAFLPQIVRPLLQKHYDYDWLEEFMQHGARTISAAFADSACVMKAKPRLLKLNQLDREEFYNAAAGYLLMLRGTGLTVYKDYEKSCAQLLSLLRKEYNPESILENKE
jgi:hypothetical protein